MAKNRIGIEVAVQFPTITELQEELNSKWDKVKGKLELNVDVNINESQIRAIRDKINDILNKDKFELNVKLNLDDFNKDITKVVNKLEKLDAEFEKKREIRIGVKVDDLDKSFKDIMNKTLKEKEIIDSQNKGLKQKTLELGKQSQLYDKIQTTIKETKDGETLTTTKKTQTLDNGNVVTETNTPSGRLNYDITDNRVKALNEVIKQMKVVNDLEEKSIGKGKEELVVIENKIAKEKESLNLLKEQYNQKYSTNVEDDDLYNKQKAQHQYNVDLKTAQTLEKERVKNIEDETKSLNEINKIQKNIYDWENKKVGLDEDSQKIIDKQIAQEKELLSIAKEVYQTKFGKSNFSSGSTSAQETTKALKEQKEYSKDIKDFQSEINKAIAQNAQLEKKKQEVVKKMVGASQEEVENLRQQADAYSEQQKALEKKYGIAREMTAEQKEELANIQRIGAIQEEGIRISQSVKQANKEASKEAQAQANADKERYDKIISSLKDVHRIRLQIQEIESKGNRATDKESLKLASLKAELSLAKDMYRETNKEYALRGQITDDIVKQIQLERESYKYQTDKLSKLSEARNLQADILDKQKAMTEAEKQAQKAREKSNSDIDEQKDKQNRINSEIKEYLNYTKQIGQLQRDLIFAGLRERTIIENAIQELDNKKNAIRDNLSIQNQLTDAVKREVHAIEEAQARQRKLNKQRSEAREKDMAYNDTGGLIDPFQFAHQFEMGARTVIESVARMDAAMTGITKVAEGTKEQFEELAKTSYDTASTLGVSADQYLLAIEKWVTAGKSLSESQDLAQTSLVGAFVGNIQADDMVNYMAVPLNAFAKAGLEANDIINIMNETSNNHAVEMEHLGKAYMRSATTAKDAGVSFGELTGMITGAQEATRKGGEKIGTGIKSIALNITNMSAAMTAGEQRKKDFFEGIGVQMADEKGQMLSMTDIIGNLVGVWGSLTDEQKGTAKYYMAGKEHAETLGAIIDQWERVQQVSKESDEQLGLGEMGSAYQEHIKQSDSVKFKLAELQNAWDEMLHTVGGGSGGVADFLDLLINGLEKLTSLLQNDEFTTALKYILAGVGIHATTNLFKRFFDTITTGFNGYKRNIEDIIVAWKNLDKEVGKTSKKMGEGSSGVVVGTGNDKDKGNNGNDKDSNSSGGGVAVLGGGALANTSKKAKEASKDVDEITNSAKKADEAVKGIGKAGNTTKDVMSGLGKVSGKLVGLIPLLGDALLVAEIMGVPVFDKIGEMVDGLIKTNEELQQEIEDTAKKFIATNDILSGGYTKTENKVLGTVNEETGEREGGMQQAFDSGKGKKGYLNEEEFTALQTKFNELAEVMNLELKIEFNDNDHIQSRIDEMTNSLNKMKTEGIADIGKQFEKETETIQKAQKKMGELKFEEDSYEGILKANDEILEKYDERIEKGGFLTLEEQANYKILSGSQEDYKKKLDEVRGKIEEQEGVIEAAKGNMEKYASSMVEFINAGGSVAGMSAQQVAQVFIPMRDEYNKLQKSINGNQQALAELNSEGGIQKSTYDKIRGQFPELTNMTYEQATANSTNKQKLQDLIGTQVDSQRTERDRVRDAINGLLEENGMRDLAVVHIDGQMSATGKLKDSVSNYNSEIGKVKPSVTTTLKLKAKEVASNALTWVKNLFGTSGKTTADLTVNVRTQTSKNSGGGHHVEQNVSSVSANTSSIGGELATTDAQVQSINNATSSSSNSDARVDSDYWRYGAINKKIDTTDFAINKLEIAINKAGDNQEELIKLYEQQQKLLRQQLANEKALKSAKMSELGSVLSSLKSLGFKIDSKNQNVTNLDYAKKLKGDKAERANTLLGQWQSLYKEVYSITESISKMELEVEEMSDTIRDTNIDRELKKFEKRIKTIDALLTSINNKDSFYDSMLGYVDSKDVEKKMKLYEYMGNSSKANIKSLIEQYNKLSTTLTTYPETAEEIKGKMESLRDEILSQADAVLEYQEAVNDLEFNRVTDDLDEFNRALEDNNSRLENNITNVKEGLLSGTSLGGLMSSQMSDLNLYRDNVYGDYISQRLYLEKSLQTSLDNYAKINVDREKRVANARLAINVKMYNKMLEAQSKYSKNVKSNTDDFILSDIYTDKTSEKDFSYTLNDTLTKAYQSLMESQNALNNKYQKSIEDSLTNDDIDRANEEFIMSSLEMQEEYFGEMINGYKEAIEDLKDLLKDVSLTDTQRSDIVNQINSYENEIITAQNNIKSAIESRFEYEFSLLDKVIEKYDDINSELSYRSEILEMINADSQTLINISNAQINNERTRNAQLAQTLSNLKRELSYYDYASYEWNIINEKVEEYRELLQDSNKTLLDMNANILSMSFSDSISDLEKMLFDGRSKSQYSRYQDLWVEGLEKELSLDATYQKISDLGNQMYKEQLDLLSKKDKISRNELDYINTQLDILELEQKLANLNSEKTVQTLKQKEDGTWDYVYEADASELSSVQEELDDARLNLVELEKSMKEDYLNNLEEVLGEAEDGQYKNIQEFKEAISEVDTAFSSLINSLPNLTYSTDIMNAFLKYLVNSKSMSADSLSSFNVSSIGIPSVSANVSSLNSVVPYFNGSSVSQIAEQNKSVTINLDKIEFPNVKKADGIEKAIFNLPRIALQKSKEK